VVAQTGRYPLPELGEITSQVERRWLSMLLFSAREQIDMWGDVIEKQTGVRDEHTDGIRDVIDDYRRARGWSPHGFGMEE
jgi:hypothetical protein